VCICWANGSFNSCSAGLLEWPTVSTVAKPWRALQHIHKWHLLGLECPQSRCTDPLLVIYSFQFRFTFRATTTPSQQRALDTVACVNHAQPATDKAPTSITHRQACEINTIDNAQVRILVSMHTNDIVSMGPQTITLPSGISIHPIQPIGQGLSTWFCNWQSKDEITVTTFDSLWQINWNRFTYWIHSNELFPALLNGMSASTHHPGQKCIHAISTVLFSSTRDGKFWQLSKCTISHFITADRPLSVTGRF